MSEDSKKTPYLYTHYSDFFRRIMEREIYETAPERESQFKKPYLYDEHPRSEREFMPPGNPPLGPEPPWGPIGNDCQPQGDAVGGGDEFCKPGQECGKWFWTCAHKITSFSAVGGTISGIEYAGNDTVMVTACWNKVDKKFTVSITTAAGTTIDSAVDVNCAGDDPSCDNCDDCVDGGVFPTITYVTQQMSVNETQGIYVSGGGGGPYTWSITSGGGTLNKTTTNAGEQIVYTAPATNASCANNPTIQAEDYCLQTITLKIAVNAYGDAGATAYKIDSCPTNDQYFTCDLFPPCGGLPYLCNDFNYVNATAYNCISANLGGGTCNSCSNPTYCVVTCAGCTVCQTCASLVTGGTCDGSIGTHDKRTADMITQGCCPSGLL